MAGFKDIVGNEQIIEHLQNAIALGKVSHAYILNGPEKSGKMMIAEAFAMALQCEGEGERPCLNCRSCRQAMDHNQPDIIYVSHEKPNTIGVDDIRTQINNDIDIKPYSRIGIMPVPVPKSSTFSPGFTRANPDRSTASIPKQKRPLSCMILYPFL